MIENNRFTVKRMQYNYVVLDEDRPLLSIFDNYRGEKMAKNIADEMARQFNIENDTEIHNEQFGGSQGQGQHRPAGNLHP